MPTAIKFRTRILSANLFPLTLTPNIQICIRITYATVWHMIHSGSIEFRNFIQQGISDFQRLEVACFFNFEKRMVSPHIRKLPLSFYCAPIWLLKVNRNLVNELQAKCMYLATSNHPILTLMYCVWSFI